jgi:hypothetical protein
MLSAGMVTRPRSELWAAWRVRQEAAWPLPASPTRRFGDIRTMGQAAATHGQDAPRPGMLQYRLGGTGCDLLRPPPLIVFAYLDFSTDKEQDP